MLEELYDYDRRVDLVMKDRPALALLERSKLRGGQRYTHIPLRYVKPMGRSATFSDAQTNRNASEIEGFQVTYVSNYGYATVDGDVIDDAGENVELVAEALEFEMDGAIENLSDDLAHSVYRNVGGARGVVGTVSTTTITLATLTDIVNFEQNMELVASENDGSDSAHTLQDSGASATVTAIDYDAGTLTSDSNWTSQMSSLDAGDFLFVEGDFKGKLAGFDSWVPSSAPSSTAFYGVDRSVNTRLGGLRYTGTGMPIEEAIMDAKARAARWGSKVDIAFMEPLEWNKLQKSLESKGQLTRDTRRGTGDAARFGFDVIQHCGIDIVSDPFAPAGVVRMLQSNTWTLRHSGDDLIRVIDHDDNKFMRETSNDGVEFRIKFRGNLTCKAPGHNMRLAI